MRDEVNQSGWCANLRQIDRTIQWMEASPDEIRRISNIMEDCCCFKEVSIQTSQRPDSACLPGNTLYMCPSARQ